MSAKKATGTVKVTLKKSLIGRNKKHISGVKGLGLRKIGQSIEVQDTPEIRGIINQVHYLLEVEA